MVAPLTLAYRSEMERLRMAAADVAGTAWDALSADTSNPAEYLGLVVPVVTAAQAQAAITTDAYLTRAAGVAPLGVTLDDIARRLRGVELDEVYARPFHTVWFSLSKGADAADAVSAGRARAVATAATDVALAMRATNSFVGREVEGIGGFVRVGGACELCASVEGEEYADGGDMEMHPGCGCTAEPIIKDAPAFPNEGSAIDLTETDTITHDHGELGPLLANRGDEFRDIEE